MSTAPTFTLGAANTASSLRTASTTSYGGGQLDVTSPKVQISSGGFALSTNKFVGAGMSNGQGGLRGTAAMQMRIRTMSPSIDICYFEGVEQQQTNPGIALYITDVATGVRQRAQLNDYRSNDSAAWRYLRFDLPSAADRIWELSFDATASLRSFNLAPGYDLVDLPATPASQPKIQFVWDSYGEPGVVSQASVATDMVKKGVLSQFAEKFGCPNPQINARGGTGFLNPANTLGTYATRRGYGDTTRYGQQDLFAAGVSLNDDVGLNAAYTDSALSDAMKSYFQGVAADQPSPTIIMGWGPQTSVNRAANQTRWNVAKAAFLSVAAADAAPSRFVWLDGSPSGDDWFNGVVDGPDNTHMVRAWHDTLSTRMANTAYNALVAIAG